MPSLENRSNAVFQDVTKNSNDQILKKTRNIRLKLMRREKRKTNRSKILFKGVGVDISASRIHVILFAVILFDTPIL